MELYISNIRIISLFLSNGFLTSKLWAIYLLLLLKCKYFEISFFPPQFVAGFIFVQVCIVAVDKNQNCRLQVVCEIISLRLGPVFPTNKNTSTHLVLPHLNETPTLCWTAHRWAEHIWSSAWYHAVVLLAVQVVQRHKDKAQLGFIRPLSFQMWGASGICNQLPAGFLSVFPALLMFWLFLIFLI